MSSCAASSCLFWNITVWIPTAREVQEVRVGEYSELIKEYALDQEI